MHHNNCNFEEIYSLVQNCVFIGIESTYLYFCSLFQEAAANKEPDYRSTTVLYHYHVPGRVFLLQARTIHKGGVRIYSTTDITPGIIRSLQCRLELMHRNSTYCLRNDSCAEDNRIIHYESL